MGTQNEFLETCTGLIIFQISGLELSADIGQIKKIVRPSEIKTSFQFDFSSLQYVKIDDSTIPLIELHSLFGLKFRKKSDHTRIIIADPNNKIFAFPVDKVEEILTIRKGYNVEQLRILSSPANEFLMDLILDEKKYSLMNFEKILEVLPKEIQLTGSY